MTICGMCIDEKATNLPKQENVKYYLIYDRGTGKCIDRRHLCLRHKVDLELKNNYTVQPWRPRPKRRS